MKRKQLFAVLSCAVVLFAMMTSCTKSPYPGYKKTDNGLYYKFLNKNEGDVAKLGDVVRIDFAYFINDSLLFSSQGNEFYDKIVESRFPGDLYEGLTMMHVGDSMSMIMPADSVFLKFLGAQELPAFVKPGSTVRWEVKLLEAMSEDDFNAKKEADKQAKGQAAQEAFNAYIQQNAITAAPTATGLIYVCTTPGKGPKPVSGQTVRVHYTGKLLDGTVFDSSVERGEPFSFTLGNGQVIPGRDEGIMLMSKGEKGTLYLPYNLAYGERAAGTIPAYSNLIFDVELIDFK